MIKFTDKFTFDGIYLLKDGKRSPCEHNACSFKPVIRKNNFSIDERDKPVEWDAVRMDCNKLCSKMRMADKVEEGKPDIKGVALLCAERPIFHELSE